MNRIPARQTLKSGFALHKDAHTNPLWQFHFQFMTLPANALAVIYTVYINN